MKRRLPVVTENALGCIKAAQIKTAQEFDLRFRLNAPTTTITCRKECSSCCNHPFLISIAEGILLYRWLREHRKWTPNLRRRFLETRDLVIGLSFDVWLLSDIECPCLNRLAQCSAYEARPLRCRITYSTGHSSLCRPNVLGPQTPLVPHADAIIDFTRQSLEALRVAGVTDCSLMPLAEAVLLGELVDTGQIDIKEAEMQFMRDLGNG